MAKNRTMQAKKLMANKARSKSIFEMVTRLDNDKHSLSEPGFFANTSNSISAYVNNDNNYYKYNSLCANNKESKRLKKNIKHIKTRNM